MFTGIIDHCGTIKTIEYGNQSLRIWIECQFSDFELGESISIDGICLTVTDFQSNAFQCDISSETVHLTLAKEYKIGQIVNLERALRLSDKLGGHFVTGHVDQLAKVLNIKSEDTFREISFCDIEPALVQKFIVKKGCITINGVSLTINDVFSDGFSIMLIPHTLEKTNLTHIKMGDAVNIEFDWMTKIISQQVERILIK